ADGGRGSPGARADGNIVGRDRRDALPFPDDLRRYRTWQRRFDPDRRRGRRTRCDAGRWRGRARRQEDRSLHIVRAEAGPCHEPGERDRCARDVDGRRSLLDAALRLLELRVLVARTDQSGEGRLESDALSPAARRRPGVHPPARSAQDGQLPVTEIRRVALSTGVTLNVALAGDPAAPAVILLHGFPESHRTWREIAPRLQDFFYLVMPDQRGFGGSDRPQEVEAYKTDILIDDIFALADALSIESFALVGHDWGGAIAWPAALRNDPRLTRLAIVNAPHPLIFQKSLIEDEAQREASQYINWFRNPGAEKALEAMGLETF